MRYHVEDLQNTYNEILCMDDEVGNYTVIGHSKIGGCEGKYIRNGNWKNHFDGARSKHCSREGIVLTSSLGEVKTSYF